jgi:hypothetical protein
MESAKGGEQDEQGRPRQLRQPDESGTPLIYAPPRTPSDRFLCRLPRGGSQGSPDGLMRYTVFATKLAEALILAFPTQLRQWIGLNLASCGKDSPWDDRIVEVSVLHIRPRLRSGSPNGMEAMTVAPHSLGREGASVSCIRSRFVTLYHDLLKEFAAGVIQESNMSLSGDPL